MRKYKLLSIIISFFTIFSLFLASCDSVEIGLGSAVDTEAAKLSVDETPKAGDVVRDSFKLSGICTDDTEIKSFTITFKETSGVEKTIEFSTTPDRVTGQWELIVDPNQKNEESGEKLIPDGEYQVSFTVIDKVDHETIVTRQFRIDNTPPVLIIERPSSKSNSAENSIDSYGQAFTLEGQSADDNDVKSIEVRVYNELPNPEKEETLNPKIITLNNVPSRINMDIAKFVEGKDNDYSEIYGSNIREGSITKKYYFELIAYDSAVRYPIDGSKQQEEDLKGNKADSYYLYSDVSTDILSKYKITDVYHILSGTYKETNTEESDNGENINYGKDYVKRYLSRSEKKTTMGSFSLNPENSPTFTIMGRSQLKAEAPAEVPLFGKGDEYSDYKATNNTTLPMEVTTGLDSIPLLSEENCKQYVEYAERYKKDPENNSDYASYVKYLDYPYSEIDEETGERKIIYKFQPYFIECDDNGKALKNVDRIYPAQISKKVSGLNHQFTITLQKDDGFQYNHNYLIGVEGFDESRNNIINSGTGYGFRFVSSGMPPAIEITEPKEPLTRLKLNDSIKFSGKISTEDGAPDLVFYLTSEDDKESSEANVRKTEIFRKSYKDEAALINEKTKLLEYYFDETIPADTFDQKQSKQYTIIVSAEDEKNSEETKNILYDVEGPNINITDIRPVVDNGERNNNINKAIIVKGNLDDAFDSVASAEWKLTQKDSDENDVTIVSGSGLKTVFNIEVNTTSAQNKKEATLTITAKDKAGNTSEIRESFFINQETDIPTITPSDSDTLTFEYSDKAKLIAGNKGLSKDKAKNIYTANSQVLMFLTDDDGIESITVKATPYPDNYGGGEAKATTTTVQVKNATEYTYPCKAPVYEGYYTIEVIVKDCTGVEKTEAFCILVSGAVPEVKITTTPEFVTTNTENIAPDAKKSFTVKGTNSGTTPFQSVERNGVPLAETVYNGYEGDNTNMRVKWTDIFTPPKPEESTESNSIANSGKVVYKAYDAYETGSEEVTFTYSLDNIHPSAVITSCLDPSTSQGASFRFIGTAVDNSDGSGVAEVQLRIDNLEAGRTSASSWKELDENETSSTDSIVSTGWIKASGTDNWNSQIVFDDYIAVFGNGKEGKKVLYVRAKDVVGNYNEITKQEFVFDKADPVLTVDESSFQRYMGSGGYALKGTASDTNALKKVTITETKIGTETAEPVTVTSVVTVGSDGKWTVNVPLENAEPESGTYKYVVVAEDVAGNKTSSNEYQTVVDITPPQLNIDRPAAGSVGTGAINETRSNFNGSVSDTSGVKYVWYKILARGSTTPAVPESSSQALLIETWNGWKLANTGTTVWDFDQTFRAGNVAETIDSLREGKWTLYITAVDNAGMVSNLLTRDFDVDMGFPTLTEDSASEFQTREGFTFNGIANDTNELTSVRITDEDDENISITVTPNENGNWSQVFKVSGEETDDDSILLSDGTHKLMIRASDVQGKITTLSRTVIVDTTAPLLEVLTPSTDTERTEINSIAENTFKFDGLLTETNTGVQNVWYKIVSSTATAPVAPVAGEDALLPANWTGWTKATSGNTLWSATQSFKAKGTGTTQTETSASNEIEEGNWKLYIYAVDKVGNVSTVQTRTFSVDMTAPAITTCEITNGNGTDCINIGGLVNGTYYFKSNLSGKVIATDSYSMATVNEASGTYPLKVRIDGTDTVVVPNTNTTSLGEWTIPSSAFTEGTKQTVIITATDIVGKTTTRTFNVCYDVTAPLVEIEYPANGTNITTSTVEARGTITEHASGINKLQYTLTENPEENDWHDISCTSNTTNWTQNLEFDTEGNVVLRIRSVDNLGNQAAEAETVSFIYDCTSPTLSVTELAQYKKEDFTLSGTAWDSNAINKVEIKDDGNNKNWTYNFTAEQKLVAKDSDHAVNWSFDFVTGLANSSEDNYLSDGSHTLIITLTDAAGKTTTNSKTVFIDKSNPQIVSAVIPTAALTEGASFRFTGVAKDYFGGTENAARDSGLSKVEIQIVNKNTVPTNGTETANATGWIEATGLEAWSTTIVFASYDVFNIENKKTLCVRATDTVGNVSEIYTQDFDYDKAIPSLTVVSYTATAEGSSALSLNQVDLVPLFEVNGNFSLNGTASDGYGISSIVITQKIGEGEEHTITTINPTASSQYVENGNWSVNNLPRNPENVTESLTGDDIISGIYTYKVTITDAVGKASTKTVKAVIDRTAPTVNITTPNSTTSNTGLNAISVVSFRFAGTAGDSGDGATGVEKVWYEILAQNGTPKAAPTTNTTIDTTWTSQGFKLASNTTSWFFLQPIISGTTMPVNTSDENYGSICEGKYKLSVYAVDKAGNVSSAASQIFDVDMAAPEIETVLDGTLLDESMTQTKTNAYSFKYKVAETYGFTTGYPQLTIRKDNAKDNQGNPVYTNFTPSEPDANGYITVTIGSEQTPQADGLYEYIISATDAVGKSTIIKRNILLDTTPPTLTVISPELSVWQNAAAVTVNGSAEDKSGTFAVWYLFGVDSIPVSGEGAIPSSGSSAKEDSVWTGGWTKAEGSTSWSINVTGEEGIPKKLFIVAVDENGAVTTGNQVISTVVKVDTSNPNLTEDGIGAGTQYKNAGFTLSGTASDNGSGLVTTNPVTITGGATPYYPAVAADTGAWSQSITPASEGTYTYTIKAKDIAGRESTESRTVVYDTTAPSITTKTVGNIAADKKAEISGTTWYKTTQIPVIVAGSDNLAGISFVECSTDWNSTDTENPENGNWTTLNRNAEGNYTGTISCNAQGVNTIYARITDQAGNKSNPVDNTITVYIDTLAPDAFTLGTVDGSALEGVKLVNGHNSLTFTFIANDSGVSGNSSSGCGLAATEPDENNYAALLTKIGTVDLTQSPNTPIGATLSNGVYSIEIPVEKMSADDVTTPVNIIVTLKDGLGNSAEFTAFQLQKDNIYPLAKVGTIKDADASTTDIEVNGIITVSGTSSDTHTLTGIKLQYQTSENGTSGWSDWTDYSGSNTTGSNYSWSYTIDTTNAFGDDFDNKFIRFRAIATDQAGNSGNTGTTTQYCEDTAANNKVVKVYQYTDRPVIRFTNLDLSDVEDIWLTRADKIFGLISDDDGDVTSLKYKLSTADSWTSLTPSAGSGYFEITAPADGENTIYFQVTDAAGKIFETDTSTNPVALNQPILSDGTNKIDGLTSGTGNGTVALTLKVDQTSPMLQNKQYQIFNKEKGTNGQWGNWVATNAGEVWTENAWSSTLGTLGGRYTGLRVKLEAKDENSITSVTSIFGGTLDNPNTVTFTCDVSHDDASYHEWKTGNIAIPDDVTEVINLVVTITDGAGLDTKETIPVEIDNSAPIINIQEPSALIGTTETIKGNITTVNGSETREAKLYYAVSRYDTNPNNVKPADSGTRTGTDAETGNTIVLATAWEEIKALTTSLNWYVYFDDLEDADDHTDRFAYYLAEGTQAKPYLGYTTKAAIDNGTFETETQLYFWIKAVDSTGNASVAHTALHVDPQGDRPTVTLSYPADVQNSSGQMVAPTLGGSIRLNGTATDNRYAKYVWVQIEKPNNSGVFDGFDAADLAFMNTNSNGERTYGYELGQISTNSTKTISEIAAAVAANTNISDYGIRVPVTGSSWFAVVNKEGEYSPEENSETNTKIKFTIIATDETELAAGSTKINKSHAVTQEVLLDSDTPYIDDTQLKLIQYETSSGSGIACTDGSVTSGTIINNIPYVNGMSINGIWFLTGKITDDGGISSVKVDGVERVSSAGSSYDDNGIKLTPVAHTTDGTKYDYTFQVPVGNNEEGQVGTDEVRIIAQEVKDQNPLSVDKTYGVTYDNLAPVFITSNNTNVTLPTSIQDSSGFFTFGAVATEDSVGNGQNAVSQSGIERIAFYFTRDLGYNIKNLNTTQYSGHETDATVTHDLFDVMISSENRDSDDTTRGNIIIDYASGAVTENEVFVPSSSEMKTNYKYEDHLIWQSVTDCTVSGAGITLPNNSNTKNIHKGGLAKINGAIYRISGVSANIVNIEGEPGDGTSVEVLFAIANIIDNNSDRMGSVISSTKGYGYGYYTGNTQDDGDLMIETFNRQQTSWIFDASVKSTNLPDGPITLHIVAMDKAGNVSEYAYNATINNNGPRIAGILIGTDENGNGEVDDTESYSEFNKTTYHSKYVNGKNGNSKITEATFPTPDQQNEGITTAIKAKGKIKIKPEIIGGNNTLKYTYDVYYRNAQNNGWNTEADYSKSVATNFGTGAQDQVADIQNIVLDVSDFVKPINGAEETESNPGRIKDGNNHKFVFHISDTTPAWTEDGASQSTPATLSVIMDVLLRDSVPAKNYIIPFYWKDASSNSLFGNSTNNGHIELAKDWVRTNAYTNGSSTALYDADPKVSGKIKLEGIAQDNSVLKEIKVQFNKAMGGLGENEVTIATYNGGTNSNISANWTLGSSLTDGAIPTQAGDSQGWAAEITKATYGELLAAAIIDSIPSGKQASDFVPETSQTYGHVVHWILYLDTAYVENGAATDVTITATATDKGKPTWNGSTVAYGSNTESVSGSGYSGAVTETGSGESATVTEGAYSGSYKVDIVPYITSLGTALANLKKNNPSVFARTALGHYPVAITTLNDETTRETITATGFNLSGGTVTFAAASGSATVSYNSDGFGIPANAKSGKMSITVNGVESLNNVNNNNARGNYTGTVNLATKPTGDKSVYDNYYNRQPNGDNNNLLTDDVEVDVWEFHTDAVTPISGNIEQPQMKINPVTGQLGFAFANGPAYFSMPGKVSETDYSYQYWTATLDFFTSVGLAYDKLGYSYAVAAGGDINSDSGKNTADKYVFLSDRIGKAFKSDKQAYSTKQADNAIKIESVGMKGTKENTSDETYYFEKQRAKSSSLATAVHGVCTNVYLAYYDSMTDEIRFKYGSTWYPNKKVTGYTDSNQNKIKLNATEYMKWYYHAVYKQEEDANANRSLVFKGKAVNAPNVVTYATISGVNSEYNKKYDAQSFISGSTGVSDSGISADINILSLKDYSPEEMNEFVEGLISAKLTASNRGTEESEYQAIMEAADVAYAEDYATEFWGTNDNGWGTTGRGWATHNNGLKGILEGINVSIDYKKAEGTDGTKYFGDFQNTETTVVNGAYPPSTYNTNTVSLIAGEGTGNNAGEYVSIGVVSAQDETAVDETDDDVVVAVWYDAVNRVLKYSYNDTPTESRAGVTDGTGWSDAITVFSGEQENAGEYCQLAVDANGGIHIAAYDPVNSDLVYAYLSSYDDTSPQTCVVDSSGVIGSNLTIDVALNENNNAIPRISYYSNSCVRPKLAYLADTSSVNPAGAEEDEFTGKWEVTTVPTKSTMNMQSMQYNKINVAVWKDNDGVITGSTNECFTANDKKSGNNSKTNTTSSYNSDSYGYVYGNGTSNAVLGYTVKSGSASTIETAQMK